MSDSVPACRWNSNGGEGNHTICATRRPHHENKGPRKCCQLRTAMQSWIWTTLGAQNLGGYSFSTKKHTGLSVNQKTATCLQPWMAPASHLWMDCASELRLHEHTRRATYLSWTERGSYTNTAPRGCSNPKKQPTLHTWLASPLKTPCCLTATESNAWP